MQNISTTNPSNSKQIFLTRKIYQLRQTKLLRHLSFRLRNVWLQLITKDWGNISKNYDNNSEQENISAENALGWQSYVSVALCWPLYSPQSMQCNASVDQNFEVKIPVNVWAILYFGWTGFFGQINGFTMTNYGHGNATGDHERKVTPNLRLLGRISFWKYCFKSFKRLFNLLKRIQLKYREKYLPTAIQG